MKIPTNNPAVTLTVGAHISHDPQFHVSFGRNPFESAKYAWVDLDHLRVIYFPTNQCVDPFTAGGKVKTARKSYESMYGPIGRNAVLHVQDHVVTNFEHATQKYIFTRDWTTGEQIKTASGTKYEKASSGWIRKKKARLTPAKRATPA